MRTNVTRFVNGRWADYHGSEDEINFLVAYGLMLNWAVDERLAGPGDTINITTNAAWRPWDDGDRNQERYAAMEELIDIGLAYYRTNKEQHEQST
jgi:hypothetical protein